MITGKYSFPHPVLGIDNDIEGFLGLDFRAKRRNKKIVLTNISVDLDNQYLQKLRKNDYLAPYLRIYCSSTLKSWFISIDNSSEIEIPEEDLINRVEVSGYLITEKSIEDYKDSSFHADYTGTTFTVSENEVVGITGSSSFTPQKTDEKLSLGNIFRFIPSDDEDKPTSFKFEQDQIHIMTPKRKSIQPYKLIGKKMMWTAMNLYIIPCLREAFDLVENEPAKYSDKKWFQVLDELLPSPNREPNEPYINAQLALKNADPKGLIPILNSYEEVKRV